jgi:hypothetical protein
MDLLELEATYSKSLQRHYDNLRRSFEIACKQRSIDFRNNEVSKAVLLRLKSYYQYQNQLKTLLDKVYAAPASDFFVETVLFYLKVCLQVYRSNLQAQSERQIKGRGTPRPDISIWKKDRLVAAIECKTQLGWNRHGWREDFRRREENIRKIFPEAECYLFVMTTENWPGFGESTDVGRKFFCLSRIWPDQLDEKNIKNSLLNPIDAVIEHFAKTK